MQYLFYLNTMCIKCYVNCSFDYWYRINVCSVPLVGSDRVSGKHETTEE